MEYIHEHFVESYDGSSDEDYTDETATGADPEQKCPGVHVHIIYTKMDTKQ
uniref:Uncharacterized protein n=1 Tax=Aegilops tauschii TaxID=37682 RepID=R7WC59_AEGTA